MRDYIAIRTGFNNCYKMDLIVENIIRLNKMTNHDTKYANNYPYYDQEELANLIGVSRVHFSRLLSGSGKLSFDMLIKVAYLCNLTLSEVIEYENKLKLIDKKTYQMYQEVAHE